MGEPPDYSREKHCLKNSMVKLLSPYLVDLIITRRFTSFPWRECLFTLDDMLNKADHQILLDILARMKLKLVSILALLYTCGDYRSQLAIVRILFKFFIISGDKNNVFHAPLKNLQTKMKHILNINTRLQNLNMDHCRKFLNRFNDKQYSFTHVCPVDYDGLHFNDVEMKTWKSPVWGKPGLINSDFDNNIDSNKCWVYFSLKSNTISLWYDCEPQTQENSQPDKQKKWKLLTIHIMNVKEAVVNKYSLLTVPHHAELHLILWGGMLVDYKSTDCYVNRITLTLNDYKAARRLIGTILPTIFICFYKIPTRYHHRRSLVKGSNRVVAPDKGKRNAASKTSITSEDSLSEKDKFFKRKELFAKYTPSQLHITNKKAVSAIGLSGSKIRNNQGLKTNPSRENLQTSKKFISQSENNLFLNNISAKSQAINNKGRDFLGTLRTASEEELCDYTLVTPNGYCIENSNSELLVPFCYSGNTNSEIYHAYNGNREIAENCANVELSHSLPYSQSMNSTLHHQAVSVNKKEPVTNEDIDALSTLIYDLFCDRTGIDFYQVGDTPGQEPQVTNKKKHKINNIKSHEKLPDIKTQCDGKKRVNVQQCKHIEPSKKTAKDIERPVTKPAHPKTVIGSGKKSIEEPTQRCASQTKPPSTLTPPRKGENDSTNTQKQKVKSILPRIATVGLLKSKENVPQQRVDRSAQNYNLCKADKTSESSHKRMGQKQNEGGSASVARGQRQKEGESASIARGQKQREGASSSAAREKSSKMCTTSKATLKGKVK